MIGALVVLPGAPALVPGLMGVAAAELDALREAAQTAVVTALERLPEPPAVMVLGPGDRVAGAADSPTGAEETAPGRWAGRVSTADFGPPLELPPLPGAADGAADPAVPTALLGTRWVLGEVAEQRGDAARWSELTWLPSDGSLGEAAIRAAALDTGPVLLVLALDGAASHGPKAPRAEEPSAASYDDSVVAALRSADPTRLTEVDPELGDGVGATAPELWSAVGRLLADREWQAQVCWAGHPYGIGYVVAVWTARRPRADPAVSPT